MAEQGRRGKLLLVLPESNEEKELVSHLEAEGFHVINTREGQAAYEVLDTEKVDAMIYPLRQPRIDGLRLQEVAARQEKSICAIAIATPEEIELGIEAMRQGAFDFQLTPLNIAKISAVLDRGLSYQKLVGEVSILQRRLDDRFRYGGIARRSSIWQRIYHQIEQVAQSRASVLILGETGTGKGEIAKAIHQQSRRKDESFVELNCGALPEGVVESELFGHEKGAFTSASTVRKGRFELADGGTLFLDEVGDIPLPTQVKLLRVIQDGRFERVGGTQTRSVDARLVTATHRDLDSMVEEGTFRADLFYRLNVVAIEAPPLRETRDDIPLLVDNFIQDFAEENQKPIEGISAQALDILSNYDWPGNVRELKNCIEGMVVMTSIEGILGSQDVPGYIRRRENVSLDNDFKVGMSMREIEKTAITETLKSVGNDRRLAAKILQIGLSTLYRKEQEYSKENN